MYSNSGINRVILVGEVTREPRWHNDGKERWLCFTLLTREIIFSPKGDYEHTESHRVKISDQVATLKKCAFKKNDMVYIQGKIHTKSYTDDNGVKRYDAEIIATHGERFSTTEAPLITATPEQDSA